MVTPKYLRTVVRTLEFPAVISEEQKQELETICEKLKNIYNIGLKRLLEFDENTGHYSKDTKSFNLCCPLNYEYRTYWLDEEDQVLTKEEVKQRRQNNKFLKKVLAPFSRVVDEATIKPRGSSPYLHCFKKPKLYSGKIGSEKVLSHRGEDNVILTTHELSNIQGAIAQDNCNGFSCPIRPPSEINRSIEPLPYIPPLLESTGFTSRKGVGYAIKGENLAYRPDYEELTAIPYKFRAATIRSLAVSWQEYDKSRLGQATNGVIRGKPRFKSHKDKIETIVHSNPKGVIIPEEKDDYLKGIPRLKRVKVIGLDARFRNADGSFPEIATFKFCKRPDGWTIQLTAQMTINLPVRTSKGAIACDAGIQHALIFDNGKFIDNPRWLRGRLDRLGKIQRKINHKKTHRLIMWLHHPDRAVVDIKQIINVAEKDAKALMQCKTDKEGKDIVGQKRWGKLKERCLPDSSAIAQLKTQLACQHRKIAQARKSFWDRLSTWLVENYEVFICEDGLQNQKMRGKAKPKYEDGEAQKNNSKAKSGLNLSLSDLAVGKFMKLCERKFEERDRIFIRFPAKDSTLKCPVCNTKNDMGSNYPGQLYKCSCCGYEENRDQKAAIYIAVKSWEKGKVAFDLLSEESKAVALKRVEWKNSKGKKRKKKKRERVAV